jgi:hypothetical protein
MSYFYLASPYTHPDPHVMDLRYHMALRALGWLMKRKIWTYSPIVHCHELARLHGLPRDANYWREYNLAMLDRASGMFVLRIDGIEQSNGVAGEIQRAQDTGQRTSWLTPHDHEYVISDPWRDALP